MFILNMWTACLENGFFYNHNSGSCGYWHDDAVRVRLQQMSERYFQSHFLTNAYLYMGEDPTRPTPFGFKNGGLPIVLHSNCPNNTLPIVWEERGGWHPLFRRFERKRKDMNFGK
jgi:hypothetical protein